MAAKKSVITVEIEQVVKGEKQVGKLTVGLDQLQKAARMAAQETRNLNQAAYFSALSVGIDQVQQSASKLTGIMQDLSAAYAVQQEAETKLETVMRQRMEATDAEIDSIKRLASEQQALGVIGDEVQLAGAQQVATFLTQKQSLDTLLPAMNNLLAQQKGLNATSQDAVAVGNLMGKAMQGQVSALKRVGITFTDAQAEVMKYGTESERAAMLAEIITANVGNMNAELAKTGPGQMKQLSNTLGDIKEQAGKAAQAIMPYVTMTNQIVILSGHIVKLSQAAFIMGGKIWNAGVLTKATNAITRAFGTTLRSTAVGATLVGRNSKIAAVGVKILGASLKAAFISSGIGLVIWGVSAAVEALTGSMNKANDAAEEEKRLAEEGAKAHAEWKRGLTDISSASSDFAAKEKARVDELYKAATDETATRKDRLAAVKAIQSEYPAYFANLSAEAIMAGDAADAYARLANDIDRAALARALFDKKTELAKEEIDLKLQKQQADADYKKRSKEIADASANNAILNPALIQAGSEGRFPGTNKAFDSSKIPGAQGLFGTPTGGIALQGIEDKVYASRMQAIDNKLDDVRDAQDRLDEMAKDLGLTEKDRNLSFGTTSSRHGGSNKATTPQPEPIDKGAYDTLKDYDDAIAYHNKLMQTCSKTEYQVHKQRVEELKQMRAEFTGENAVVDNTPEDISKLNTIKEMSDAISYYKARQETASESEYTNLQKIIGAIERKKAAFIEVNGLPPAPKPIKDLKSIEEVNAAIEYYTALIKKAKGEEKEYLETIIALHKTLLHTLQQKASTEQNSERYKSYKEEIDALSKLSNKEWKIEVRDMGIDEICKNITRLRAMLSDPNLTNKQKKEIESLIAAYQNMAYHSINAVEETRRGWDNAKNIVGGINSIKDAIEGQGTAWEKTSAIVDASFQIYDGLSAVVNLIHMLTMAKKADAVATGTQSMAASANATALTTESNAALTDATSQVADASAKAMNAHSWIPWVGVAMGAAAVAAIVATMLSLPKFAEGGIAYGPTLGLFGEYAGASTNPEVVAPLDKLRGMLRDDSGMGGKVTFRIDGRTLVGVLEKENKITSRR